MRPQLARILRRFGRRPADAAAALAGATVGSMVGQPITGAAAGEIITRSLAASHEDFFARRLSPDERRRAERVFVDARREIWQRFAAGEQPAEWVLTALAGNRLGSVEVLEHGLQRARDEFEERKLKHMAALLAYVFFEPQFTAGDAHR